MAGKIPRKGIFYGWFILAASFFTLFLSVGPRNGFGVFIIPMSDELNWDRGTISLALAIGWLMNGISQPFVGRLYDSFGGRKVISASLIILGSSTILLSQTNSVWFLILIFGFVMSIASSGTSVVIIHSLLAKWFRRKRGIALSIGTSGVSTGQLVLPPFIAYLILVGDWRIAWFVLGILILLLALPLAMLVLRDDPTELGLLPDGDSTATNPSYATSGLFEHRSPLETDNWRQAYRSSPMWQLTGAFFVCGLTTAIISVHYVPFAIDRGISPGTAALAFGLMGGLNSLGVLAVGSISDRLGRKYLLGTVYAIRGIAYAVLILIPGSLGLWGFAVIAGLAWVATAPLTSSLTADIYGLKSMGTLTGMNFFAHQLGGALSILMGGMLYDLFGAYEIPFGIAGAFLLGATLASFSIKEKTYSARYRPLSQPQAVPSSRITE